MTQEERRLYLLRTLLNENPDYAEVKIPDDEDSQKQLLRLLVNVRPAIPANEDFLQVQDKYLLERNRERGITDIADLTSIESDSDLYLWRGDITTLKVGAIVNAANNGMTGCWQPCHSCIDNCIHTFAGIQLRAVCADIMKKQGYEEPAGQAKITKAFNLPCDYVIHTVGPIVNGKLTTKDCELLASCYKSCLKLAEENDVGSIAFCCISTGVFCFPQEKAAEIAVKTVDKWKEKTKSGMKVVFNVFTQKDWDIYKGILYE